MSKCFPLAKVITINIPVKGMAGQFGGHIGTHTVQGSISAGGDVEVLY
jgi:hypothetical protein